MPPHGGTTRSMHGLARPRGHPLYTLARVPRGGTPMPPHEGTIHCPVCVYRYHTNHRWLRARRCTTSTGRTATPRPPMKEGTQNDLAGHTVSPEPARLRRFSRNDTQRDKPDPTRHAYRTRRPYRLVAAGGTSCLRASCAFGDDFFLFSFFFFGA